MEEEEKKWREFLASKGDSVGKDESQYGQVFYDVARTYFIAGYRIGHGQGTADSTRKVSDEVVQ